MTDEQLASVAKALAHPARVRILRLLASQTTCRGHEVFSELPLAQSTISEHLRILKEAGLVNSESVGTEMVYCLVAAKVSEFNEAVSAFSECSARCEPSQGSC